ncbi:hypothetical protein LCGC14_0365060 [marine sediment metagenome]|uniref:Uncharacterized protein n=1 Tax=marine sediment metagenome TaxID=412755 RepID=A0A0F9TCS7_9ZZZZ
MFNPRNTANVQRIVNQHITNLLKTLEIEIDNEIKASCNVISKSSLYAQITLFSIKKVFNKTIKQLNNEAK